MARMERGCEVRMLSSLFLRMSPHLKSAPESAMTTPFRRVGGEMLHFGDSCGNCATAFAAVVGIIFRGADKGRDCHRSEEHTSVLQSLIRISYAVFCLKI